MNRVGSWDFLFDILKARLSRWKASCLSIGGRVTLIKAVLENIPTYYLSLFKAPVTVLDGLERIIRKFLWGGSSEVRKIHWVAWERVTSPVDVGGLGLSKLLDVNIALLSKWVWRYRNETSSLWRRVVDAFHGTPRCWSSIPVCNTLSGVWSSIVKTISKVRVAEVNFNQLLKGEVGNGRSIRFWLDPWICDLPLKEVFPLTFKREREKKSLVSDHYNSDLGLFSGFWASLNGSMSEADADETQRLGSLLEGRSLSNRIDKWKWIGRGSNGFSVKVVKEFLGSDRDHSNRHVFKWSKWVTKKCNIFMWRLGLDRLPTSVQLRSRNCNTGSLECSLCGNEIETVDHLFCSCEVALDVWNRVSGANFRLCSFFRGWIFSSFTTGWIEVGKEEIS